MSKFIGKMAGKLKHILVNDEIFAIANISIILIFKILKTYICYEMIEYLADFEFERREVSIYFEHSCL